MSKEGASKYKGYALTPEQLIKKAQKFANDLTLEERAKEQSIKGFRQIKDEYGKISFEYKEIKRISVGEFYDKCIDDMKERYEEYKKINRTYKPFAVSLEEIKFDKTKLNESEKMSDFMYYLFDKGFLLSNTDKYPYEILELCFWSMEKSKQNPEIRKSQEIAERKIAEDKKYIMPGEKDISYTIIAQRKAKVNSPKTSLSVDQIANFDRMSDKWLVRWCNFSINWSWVAPVLCLCPFVNKGFISAIGLLLFMVAGTYYSSRVQEYCSVILPWYKEAGIMLERRTFNKL